MEWFIFALGSAILTAIASVIEKKVLFKEHATEFSATLAVMNFLVFAPLFLFVDFSMAPFIWFLIAASALFASFGFLFVAKAVRHMEISAASPLLNFGPGFTAVLAVLVLGEVLTGLNALGIIILLAGSYFLEMEAGSRNLMAPFRKIWESRYIHFIFIALISYSVSAVMGKYVLNFVSPVTLIFTEQMFIALFFLALLQLKYDGVAGVTNGLKRVGWWIILVALITVSYRYMQTVAIKMTYVSLVMPIKRLCTLFATILGGSIFREQGLYRKIMACVIMIAGASLVILG